MNRFIQFFNFLGVLALAVLCTLQWGANSQLDRQIDHLEKNRDDQAAKITEQDKTLQDTQAASDDLRQRLAIAEPALQAAQTKLAAGDAERARLIAERDQLKATLAKWVAAIAARDDVLKQANEQILKLQNDNNASVQRYNDLANKYNALVSNADHGK